MNLNDIALSHDDVEFLNEPLPFLPADIFPSTDDKQIERLNLDMNTQSLKTEVKKLKRRKANETRICPPTPVDSAITEG